MDAKPEERPRVRTALQSEAALKYLETNGTGKFRRFFVAQAVGSVSLLSFVS